MLNIRFVTGDKYLKGESAPEPLKNNTQAVNGKSEGIIILPEIIMPSATPEVQTSGSARISAIKAKIKITAVFFKIGF